MSLKEVYQISLVAGLMEAQLDPSHELLVLARKLDWDTLDDVVRPYYKLIGRDGKNSRLTVGALILKHRYNLSDDMIAAGLKENLYWRAFCGLSGSLGTWKVEKVFNASTLSRFRTRLGPKGMRAIESCVRNQLLAEGQIDKRTQLVDTTAMEKHVAYPTDTNLLDRGRRRLVKGITELGKLGLPVSVRTFARKAKTAVLAAVKLGKDRAERIEQSNRELIAMAEATLTSTAKALATAVPFGLTAAAKKKVAAIKDKLVADRKLVSKVIEQTEKRYEGVHIRDKVLSLHEPQVVTIAKGKRKQPNEYGCKVSLSIDRNGYVVDHEEYAANVADCNTLESALTGWRSACGELPQEVGGDRGYHTDELSELARSVKKIAIPTRGKTKHPDAKKPYFRRLQRQRSSIEPVISHLKFDHRAHRCRYKGFTGDRINMTLAVLAWNTKKWVRRLRDAAATTGSTIPGFA